MQVDSKFRTVKNVTVDSTSPKANFLNRFVRKVIGKSPSSTKITLENTKEENSRKIIEDWVLLSPSSSSKLNDTENNTTEQSEEVFRNRIELISNSNSDIEETEEENMEIYQLPVELICKIMSYLELNDRKNASLVCKHWRWAFLASGFLSDVVVKANNNLFVNQRRVSKGSARQHRDSSSMVLSDSPIMASVDFCLNLVNLDFEHDSADAAFMLSNLRAYTRYSSENRSGVPLLPRLKLLKLFKTTISWRVLTDLLNECPNLESLYLIHCDSLFMSGIPQQQNENHHQLKLPRLRDISLSRNRYLTDSFLNYFLLDLTTNESLLERLDLSYCLLTKTNYKSIQNQGRLEIKSSHVVLTVENLIRMAPTIFKSLKSICLNGVELFNHDEESLVSLLEHLTLLRDLQLANLPSLKVNTCVQLLDKLKQLESIDLNGSIQELNGKTIENLFIDGFKNLEIIKMHKAKINDPDLFNQNVVKCSKLTHLDLSYCFFSRSFGTLSRMNEFITQFANNIAELGNLERLELTNCEFIVNDEFIRIVSKRLTRMRHLDLRNCSKITDKSVHCIARYLTELVHLDLSWCQNVSDYGLDSSIEYRRDRELLNELNKDLNLYLKKYAEQPFLLIKQKVQIANESKKINEKKSSDIQTDNLIEEAVSLNNLKSLRTLRLESCINISDLGLYKGIDFSQLKELDVKLCPEIKGDFIFAKFNQSNDCQRQQHFTNLKILNLNQCVNFKAENLMLIVDNAPFLRELNVSAIPSVDNQFIRYLTSTKRLLTHFDVSFCPNISEAVLETYEQLLFNGFGSREFVLDKRFISK